MTLPQKPRAISDLIKLVRSDFLLWEIMNLEQLKPDRLTRGAGQLDRALLWPGSLGSR